MSQQLTIGQLMKLWLEASDPIAFLESMRQQCEPEQLAMLIATELGDKEIDRVLDLMISIDEQKPKWSRREVRTIGIYYPRFFNGGVEKFLSLIIPIYIRMGYRVIFLTKN